MLNVTGARATPGEARDRAYEAAGLISFDGMQMRTDIAARAVDAGGRESGTAEPARESSWQPNERDRWK